MTAIPILAMLLMTPPFDVVKPELLSFSVSAYTDANGMPPWGITASGVQTRDGICACGPSYDFGTLFIVGEKLFVCRDRGGAISDQHLDLWIERGHEPRSIHQHFGRHGNWHQPNGSGKMPHGLPP